jgi:cell division control protein 7
MICVPERRAIPAALMMEYDCDRRFLEFLHTQFDILRLVGSGTYGEVYECWDRVNKRTVALKRLIPGTNNTQLNRSYEEEARIIKLLAGKQNVVNLVLSPPLAPEGHLMFEDESALVLTYLCHDPPKELLQHFKQDDIRCFMRQLLLALQQVHAAGVVHNDVKLSNILYERATGRCLLVDFGLASRRLASHKASRFSNGSLSASQARLKGKLASGHVGLKGLALKVKEPRRNGTKGFRAPEVVLGSERQCSPVDLWSAGVVMLCLLTRMQQFAWLTHQNDAKAAMEFRCLRAHVPQVPSQRIQP